jgi:chitosanase
MTFYLDMRFLRRAFWVMVSVVVLFVVFGSLRTQAVKPPALVKGTSSTVYYLAEDGKRYVFPNQTTFSTWYGAQATITRLQDDELSHIPLGGNVVFRPGVRMVKITTDPKVYAVSRYGILRWITSEALARHYYGANWNKFVSDVPDAFFGDYSIGPPIMKTTEYDRANQLAAAKEVRDNLLPHAAQGDPWMTAEQKRRAMQITSVFENGTPEFEYAYVVNLDDGRGYTSGRVGFTTGTGDAYDVIRRYTERVPNNPLAKYLSRVKELRDAESGDVSGLEGYPQAWAQAAEDPIFQEIQDEIVDEVYYQPAMEEADRLGVKSAIGRTIFFDTIIQHGGGTTPDSFGALIRRTQDAMQGTPASGVDEMLWLKQFLDVRRADLAHAANEETRVAWAESVGRVDALRTLLESEFRALDRPFTLSVFGDQVLIP